MDLDSLLTPPDQWKWQDLQNKDGKPIRCGWNCPDNAKALIVLVEGRTEVIEEYFEMIRDLNAHGYACAIMDWQGQGLSYRYFDDNGRHHSEGFDKDIDDFKIFMDVLSKQDHFKTLPKVMLAHSMGGTITLHYIAHNPDIFKCAYLTAPMLGLNPKRFIKYAGAAILNTAAKVNWLEKHAFGQVAWNETIANIAKFKVSGDPVRRELQAHLFKANPKLRCGGVTFGWVAEALKSISFLHDPTFCKKITIPVFIAIAEKDIVVDNDGSHKTAALLPTCEKHVFKNAEHQIHRERDDIRDKFTKSFITFIEKFL